MNALEDSHERLEQILKKPQDEMSESDCAYIQENFDVFIQAAVNTLDIPKIIKRLDHIDESIKLEVERGQNGFCEVRDAYRGLNERVGNHERRISDIGHRLQLVESLSTNTKISVDANTELQKRNAELQQQHFEFTKTLSDRITELSDSIKGNSAAKNPEPASKIPALPWQAWLAIALVIIAALSMATGQFETFMSAFDKSKVEAKK